MLIKTIRKKGKDTRVQLKCDTCSKETVHHIDGDRQNNKLTNLALIPTNKHHRVSHQSLQKIGYDLVKKDT